MARRGEALREHILDTAKLAFLETGFERTSMDAIANQANTSKRSLYSHFATKDDLFLAVIDRVHELFADLIGMPEDYADEPVEALARFSGRILQLLGWASLGQTCRLVIAEADRLPEASARLYEAFLGQAVARLVDYVCAHSPLGPGEARTMVDRLLGQALFPALPRMFLGLDAVTETKPSEATLEADVDLVGLRRLAGEALGC